MFTKRLALIASIVAIVLLSACGVASPAATAIPESRDYNLAPEYSVPVATAAPATAPENSQSQTIVLPQGAQSQGSGQDQPYDMFFENYGVNPSIDTEDDNLSTFALDVDTGSYTIMRSYINEGNLPPADSVRVEEYVNYFEQDYPYPRERQVFNISIDGAPSPFTQSERYQVMRVGIQGYAVPQSERKDASLTFVIDVSGSMDMDNRLGLVKRSLEMLVEELRASDQVSIVVYGTEARVVLEPTSGAEKGEILHAINKLSPEGVTNAEAGIRLGYKMATRAYIPDGINRVILCSDGVANMGQIESDQILDEVRGYVDEGITLTTVGFGMDNYNDTLMEQLADDGNGFYAYVDTRNEARRLFIENLTSTLQVIALDAKIQVDFNPEVVARYRLIGFENRAVADEDFRNNEVDAGELGAGHSVTALYEVKLYLEARGRIATVNMRWEDPESHEVTEISKDFNTNEMEYDFSDASPYFQRDIVVAEYAEILRDSYWAEESGLEDIYHYAQQVSELLPRDEDMEEFVGLVHDAMRLRD